MTIISIRQPGYLAYSGFFKRIETSDVFVYLDDVLYERGQWDNRNYIKSSEGTVLLTVPAYNKFGQNFSEVKIVNSENWSKKHRTSIKLNYQKTPYFDKYWPHIEAILSEKWEKLIDLNIALIEFFNLELGYKTKTIKSSELELNSSGSEKLLEICQHLGAKTYLSGASGPNYLDEKIFGDTGINIIYENFISERYNQIHGEFIPNLAFIDLLFNEGENSKNILLKSKNYETS